jgi:hypothetical protein
MLRALWRLLKRLFGIVGPEVGDKVWSAPKGDWGEVVSKERGGFVTFRHGEQTRKGQQRYSTRMQKDQLEWHADIEAWVAGKGPQPKRVRGTVVAPTPVRMRMHGATS